MVRGSQCVPSPVRNQPLKSMHHTSLAAPQWAKGTLEGGLRRRSFRFIVNPSRSNNAPMLPPHRKATLGDLLRNRLRMMQRCPRAIEQTLHACFLIARQPLVTDPSANAETPAYGRKCFLVLLGCNYKAHPLIHGTGLHPSHRQGPPRRSVDLLPMSPVYSVTYVAG